MSSSEVGAPTGLRHDGQFRRFWCGRVGSLTAGSITVVAYPVLVHALTSSAMWVSVVVAAQGLPYLLFGLLAGVVADRVDRKALMAASEAINAVALASVPLLHLADRLGPGHVVAVALVSRTTFVLYDAANLGAVPSLVHSSRLPVAQAVLFGSSSVIEMGVPGLAGVVLALVHPAMVFTMASVLAGAAALAIARVRRPMAGEPRGRAGTLRADLLEGLQWLWRAADVRAQTLLAAAQVFAQGMLVASIVGWASDLEPGRSAGLTGLLFGAWATGGLVAALAVPWLVRRLGETRAALLASPLPPVSAMACAVVGTWQSASFLVALWGAGTMAVVLTSLLYRQVRTPDAIRSRVNTAGRVVSYGIGFPAGGLLAGWAASVLGVAAPFVLAAVVLAVASGLGWMSRLRHLRGPAVDDGQSRARGTAAPAGLA